MSLLTLLSAKRFRYLLGPFRFTQDASAPLTSPYTEGGAVGSLTATDLDTKLSISAGALQAATGVSNWGRGGVAGTSLSRAVGRALFCSLTPATTTNGGVVYFGNGGASYANVQDSHSLYFASSTINIITAAGTSWAVGAFSAGTTYDCLIIQRGTGAFIFVKLAGVWTLLYVLNAGTTTPLFASATFNGVAFALDNLRVLDLSQYDSRFLTDWGIALNRSTFTAANGTALTAITPEVGGAWTQPIATWNVQSNKAQPITIVSNTAMAVAESNSADALVEVTVNFSTVQFVGLTLRYTDANNYWIVNIRSDNTIKIIEVAAGVVTARASVAFTPTTGVDYRLVVVLEGSTITAYVNNANKVTYASATSNQTVTKHGLYYGSLGTATQATLDDFAVYPRTLTLPSGI